MSRITRGFVFIGVLAAGLATTANAQTTITVAPGSTPVGGYLGLSDPAFGGAFSPISGFGDNSLLMFDILPFQFGGRDFSRIGIASNGYITVGSPFGDGTATNQHLPDLTAPNGVIAPLWTDLDPSAGGGIFLGAVTDGVNTWTIVDWEGVPNAHDHTQLNTFEIWLRNLDIEDISFGYQHLDGPDQGKGTIGAENVYGTIGDSYFFNGAGTLPGDNDALVVTSHDAPNLPEPSTVVLMATGLVAIGGYARRQRGRQS